MARSRKKLFSIATITTITTVAIGAGIWAFFGDKIKGMFSKMTEKKG